MMILILFAVMCAAVKVGDPVTDKLASQVSAMFEANINATAKSNPLPCRFMRQAHVKSHGCLVGRFVVNSGLPFALSTGVFNVTEQGKNTFDALIRFSNGKGNGFAPGNPFGEDDSNDVRGLAVKLFGVKGAKIHQPNAETVDMLAVTADSLFLDDISEALPYFSAATKNSSFAFGGFLLLHPIIAKRLLDFASSGTTFDLLDKDYYTVAPLTLGGVAAKFKFSPCVSNGNTNPLDTTSDNYMSRNLRTYFAKQQFRACFNVSAQLFVNNRQTPIDDLSSPWPVPYQSVATLFIEPQDVWSSVQKSAMCESVAFHPYQSLVANKPQGWVQEIRGTIMDREQKLRHFFNMEAQSDWSSSTLQQYIVA